MERVSIYFSAMCPDRGWSNSPEADFVEIKSYGPHTSLKMQVRSIKIDKFDIVMMKLYMLSYCCDIMYSVIAVLNYFLFICLHSFLYEVIQVVRF